MVTDGGKVPSNVPLTFPYVLFITLQPITLVAVYYSTFLLSLSLGTTRRLLCFFALLKQTWIPTLPSQHFY